MKQFNQFIISTVPPNNELVSGLLWQLNIDGINDSDSGLTVFADSSKNINRSDIEIILNEMIKEELINSFSIQEGKVEDKNWNEEYEKNVRIIEVSDRIVIKPSFKDYDSKAGQIIITIDPKMSFGTGEHATTRLMIGLIETHIKGGEKVLDIGSGTGVLAICAVKLGAASALGIDNDEWCILNGIENIQANGLSDKVEIRLAELNRVNENDFDLIAANINKHILMDIAEEISRKIKKTGILILSGLLIVDEEEIINKYTAYHFELIEIRELDEWCAIAFRVKD